MRVHTIASFSVVILLIIVIFAGVVTVPAAAQTNTGDWMMFRYDNQHTGDYSPVAGSNTPQWKSVSLGEYVLGSPAVVNGVIYVEVYWWDMENRVYALNATTGAKLWNFTTAKGVNSTYLTRSPAVVHGVVYVGCDDGKVYALNAETGAKLWNFTTGGPVWSSPAVVDGIVLVGSKDSNVYALNATTGAKLWNYTTGGPVLSSPALGTGVVYVGSNDSNVYALNTETGAKLWNYTTGGPVLSSPALGTGGDVYVGSDDGNVYALNQSGAKLWNFATGDSVESSPAFVNGVVFVGSIDYNVYALNARTGTKLWTYWTGDPVYSSPAVANGVVYVGSDDGNVYAFNAATGVNLGSFIIGGRVHSAPAVANGVVYVGSTVWLSRIDAVAATSQGTTLGFETVLAFVVLAFVALVFVGLVIDRFLRGGRRSAALLAGLDRMRKRMGRYTIGLLIWLTLYLIYRIFSASDAVQFLWRDLVSSGSIFIGLWGLLNYGLVILRYSSDILATILYALAIVGIIIHYYRGETASLRWGPLCGIAGVVFQATAHVSSLLFLYNYNWFSLYITNFLETYAIALAIGIPSYFEYVKEGAPVTVERVMRAALSGRDSTALVQHIEHIEGTINQVQKRIRRDLTLLTVALPIIFTGPMLIAYMLYSGRVEIVFSTWALSKVPSLVIVIFFGLFGVLFIIVAVAFSSLLKKPRFALLSINDSEARLELIAAAERGALVKDARQRLAIFLLAFAFPVFWWISIINELGNVPPDFVEMSVSFLVLILSALVCFLLGYWVLTRSGVAAIARDESALHGLLDASIGVLPTKVRAGDAQSVLMDFNFAAASADATSSAGDTFGPSAVPGARIGEDVSSAGAARSSPLRFCPHCGAPLAAIDRFCAKCGMQTSTEAGSVGSPRPHYEVELQAAGATVDGEKRFAIFDVPATLKGIWNCLFPTAGTQALHLLLKEVRPTRATEEGAFDEEPLFAYTHDVRVDGRFTASSDNAVAMIGIVITTVSVIITLVTFIPH